mmetsp:Transcript_7629/g.12678  ORF Transcript_7629/g.12678 Transcript_7629/m.12678 type:complete len:573 (+) Transcript_7629:66-1784(+)
MEILKGAEGNDRDPVLFSATGIEAGSMNHQSIDYTLLLQDTFGANTRDRNSPVDEDSTLADVPKDGWPFLLRFPVNLFAVSTGFCAQSVAWKAIQASQSGWIPIARTINTIAWVAGLLVLTLISCIYIAKTVMWPRAVLSELFSEKRYSFFAFPILCVLFLSAGTPNIVIEATCTGTQTVPPWLAYSLAVCQLLFNVMTYQLWIVQNAGRQVQYPFNPTFNISVVGNFVSALVLVRAEQIELGKYMFFVGILALALFYVAIYQATGLVSAVTAVTGNINSGADRTNIGVEVPLVESTSLEPIRQIGQIEAVLPPQPDPRYLLFVAPPSVASVAWVALQQQQEEGETNDFGRFLFFLGFTLFVLLCRNLAVLFSRPTQAILIPCWALTFPSGAMAVAVQTYANTATGSNNSREGMQYFALIALLYAVVVFLTVLAWTINGLVNNRIFSIDPVLKGVLTAQLLRRNRSARHDQDQGSDSEVGSGTGSRGIGKNSSGHSAGCKYYDEEKKSDSHCSRNNDNDGGSAVTGIHDSSSPINRVCPATAAAGVSGDVELASTTTMHIGCASTRSGTSYK